MSAEPMDGTATPVVVQRWRRFGHDRAYVKVGGDQVGYRDLRSGEIHCSESDLTDLVERATTELLARARDKAAADYTPRHARPVGTPAPVDAAAPPAGPPVPPIPPVPPVPTAPVAPGPRPDADLGRNAPGESARRQAIEHRDAAPVRTLLARVVGAKTDERAWRIGADGEEAVARRLAKLGPEWRVLHAIPVGDNGSDIDHLVIGPAGVFTVNAKHHPQAKVWVGGDTVKVNGTNLPYVRNSRHEARRAARLLSAAARFDVEVAGIIAIMGAHRGFTVKAQPADGAVAVVTRKEIGTHLRGLPVRLGEPSINRIHSVARHLATWQPKTVRWEEFS